MITYQFLHIRNHSQIPAPERKDVKAHREREAKWLSIVSKMDAGAVKKDAKLKKLVRAGIPASVRGKAWQFLAGSAEFRKDGLYEVGYCGGKGSWNL